MNLKQRFDEIWEKSHEGLQITVARKAELKRTAEVWFLHGVHVMQEEYGKVLNGGQDG